MAHLTTLQVPSQCSFAADGQASVIQHTKHKQCQEHDDTSKHSNCYTCDLRAGRKVFGWGKHNWCIHLTRFVLSDCNQKRALLTCSQVCQPLYSWWAQGLCICWGDKITKTNFSFHPQCSQNEQPELTSVERVNFSATYPLVQLRWQGLQWPSAFGYLNMVWPFSPFTPLGQVETQWGPSIRFEHASHWSAPWCTKKRDDKLI